MRACPDSYEIKDVCFMQGDPARTTAEIITLGSQNEDPQVEHIDGPNVPRTFANAVVLPTGEVALFGGSKSAVEFSDDVAVYATGAIV